MKTNEHQFGEPSSLLASLCFRSQFSERIPNLEERGPASLASVFIYSYPSWFAQPAQTTYANAIYHFSSAIFGYDASTLIPSVFVLNCFGYRLGLSSEMV